MAQEIECASLERHEGEIREIKREQNDARVDVARVEWKMERLEELAKSIATNLDSFISFSREQEEKRQTKDEAREEKMLQRFETIEGKIMLASPLYKLVGNIVTIIITGVVLLVVAKSIPELSNFLS